jgi:VWFA-related protein
MTSSELAIPVRQLAREFIERHVDGRDVMAVFSTGGFGVINQEFTNDKARVLQVIDRFQGRMCKVGESDAENIYRTRVSVDVMATLATHLAGIRGRRVSLLWISEGFGYDGADAKIAQSFAAQAAGSGANIGDVGTFAHALRQALDALRAANVTLYAVDPRKLGGVGCENRGFSQDVLRNFSDLTGGFAAVNGNDYREEFDRINAESSQYYVLGFQPSRPALPSEFHKIQVRIVGRPRIRVSARPGYVVPATSSPTPQPADVAPVLADALVRNLPTAGLPLRVQAIPRRGPGGMARVSVVVEVAGGNLRFAETNGRHQERLEFALRSIDFLARSDHNQKTTVTLNLSPLQLEDLQRTQVRWLSTLEMKPGHYSLRVAGHGLQTATTGSVFLDIDVPRFDEDRLWVGGLAVASPQALAVQAGSLDGDLGLSDPPTTKRTFIRGDEISLAAEAQAPASFT